MKQSYLKEKLLPTTVFLFWAFFLTVIFQKNIFSFSLNYTDYVQYIKNTHKSVFEMQYFELKYFSPIQFQWIRIIWSLLLIIFFLLGLFCWKFYASLQNNLIGFIKFLRKYLGVYSQIWQKSSPFQKRLFLVLLVAIIAHKVYYLYQYPIMIDEMFSYIHFAKEGASFTASYYPVPNNHIFFNVVISLLDFLPLETVWLIRLPSLFAFLLILLLWSYFFCKKMDFYSYIFFLLFVGFFASSSFYAIQGRGYMLMNLFVSLHFLSVWAILKEKEKYFKWIFLFSGVLGFYTLPIFLYHYVAINLWYVLWSYPNKNFLKICLGLNLQIILLVGILFLPVILFSGQDVFVANRYYLPQSTTFFFQNVLPVASLEAWEYLIGFGTIRELLSSYVLPPSTHIFLKSYFIFPFILGLAIYLFFREKKQKMVFRYLLSFIVCSIVSFFVIVTLMRNFPPYRTLGIYAILGSIFLTLVWRHFTTYFRISKCMKLIFMVCLSILVLWISYKQYEYPLRVSQLPFSQKLYQELDKEVTILYNTPQIKIFTNSNYFSTYLLHKSYQKQAVNQIDNYRFIPKTRYDIVILDEDTTIPVEFEEQNYFLQKTILGSKIYHLKK